MKRRGLSDEEARLWRGIAKTVRPMNKPQSTKPTPHGAQGGQSGASPSLLGAAGPVPKAGPVSKAGPVQKGASPSGASKKHKRTASVTAHPKPSLVRASPVGAGDPRLDRRAARRRLPIERTLDLHGLTQAAAKTRLAAFIREAYAADLRCVLIVTGKGGLVHASNLYDAPSNQSGQDDPFWGAPSKGVLRRNFPDWVSAPALRPMIARVAPAHQKDGGDGAWYVFLKRNDRGL